LFAARRSPSISCTQRRTAARRNVLSIERVIRNAGFALASAAIILVLGYTIEVLPVVSASVH
jgi:hypothetical protein